MPAYIEGSVEQAAYFKSLMVNALREGKLNDGFYFNGVLFDSHPEAVANITGACSLAILCLLGAAQWPLAYEWIAADNTRVLIPDPVTMLAFGQALGAHRSGVVFAARGHKDALLAMTCETHTLDAVDSYDIFVNWEGV